MISVQDGYGMVPYGSKICIILMLNFSSPLSLKILIDRKIANCQKMLIFDS